MPDATDKDLLLNYDLLARELGKHFREEVEKLKGLTEFESHGESPSSNNSFGNLFNTIGDNPSTQVQNLYMYLFALQGATARLIVENNLRLLSALYGQNKNP